jgi:hypothetical protein
VRVPLDIDMSRPFGNAGMREELVRSVYRAAKTNETRWLEWKGPFDLGSKEGQFKLAHQIIGFANRPVGCQAHRAGGHAYVVVGAERGDVRGMPPADLDPVVLEGRIGPLVGDGGSAPRWTPFSVPVDGKYVLVVDIDPPRWGDPIYVLRTGHGNWQPGQIFVRHKASVDRPTAADMDALNERVAGGLLHEVQIELVAAPRPNLLRPFRLDDEELETLIQDRQREALSSLKPVAPSRSVHPYGGTHSLEGFQDLARRATLDFALGRTGRPPDEPDTRTEAQFRTQVDRYASECRAGLPAAGLWNLYRSGLAEVVLVATNVTQRPLVDVEIRVHFEGDVGRLQPKRADEPPEPWPFGKPKPVRDPWVDRGICVPSTPLRAIGVAPPRPIVTDGGSVDIKYPPVTLRAGTPHHLDGVPLLIDPSVGSDLRGTWTATSTVASGIASGLVDVALGPPLTLGELLALPHQRP